MNSTALILIATGERYHQYIRPLIDSAKQFFVPHDVFLWTDSLERYEDANQAPLENRGFPKTTLYRYHTLLTAYRDLITYSNIFWCDIDMRFVAPVGEEVFSPGWTAVLHPGYCGSCGTPERRPESTAFIPYDAKNSYYCGGFQGGEAKTFLNIAEQLKEAIDIDERNGIIPIWNDESCMNAYLYRKPPAKVLDPSYCYPDVRTSYYTDKWRDAGLGEIKPRILALEKPR